MKTWGMYIDYINTDLYYSEELFTEYHYWDYEIRDDTLYGQVFNINFNNEFDHDEQYDFF